MHRNVLDGEVGGWIDEDVQMFGLMGSIMFNPARRFGNLDSHKSTLCPFHSGLRSGEPSNLKRRDLFSAVTTTTRLARKLCFSMSRIFTHETCLSPTVGCISSF